jgi:hypothetical protein
MSLLQIETIKEVMRFTLAFALISNIYFGRKSITEKFKTNFENSLFDHFRLLRKRLRREMYNLNTVFWGGPNHTTFTATFSYTKFHSSVSFGQSMRTVAQKTVLKVNLFRFRARRHFAERECLGVF